MNILLHHHGLFLLLTWGRDHLTYRGWGIDRQQRVVGGGKAYEALGSFGLVRVGVTGSAANSIHITEFMYSSARSEALNEVFGNRIIQVSYPTYILVLLGHLHGWCFGHE